MFFVVSKVEDPKAIFQYFIGHRESNGIIVYCFKNIDVIMHVLNNVKGKIIFSFTKWRLVITVFFFFFNGTILYCEVNKTVQ